MIELFKPPSLGERLRMELAAVQEARVAATARAAHWQNQEKFLLAEAGRLNKELAELELPAVARKPQAVEK